MKDAKEKKTVKSPVKSANARRQEAYRQRQRAAGKRQRVVWIKESDWQAGFAAGEAGQPASPVPPGIDGLSWVSGWIEGDAKRQREEGKL